MKTNLNIVLSLSEHNYMVSFVLKTHTFLTDCLKWILQIQMHKCIDNL